MTIIRAIGEGGTTAFRILVVEDNQDTRDMLCELLRLLGHHPHSVSSAEQALAYIVDQGADILFTDVRLPGMSGIELATKVAAGNPSMRIIVASGYPPDQTRTLPVSVAWLIKPYDLTELQTALSTFAAAGNHP